MKDCSKPVVQFRTLAQQFPTSPIDSGVLEFDLLRKYVFVAPGFPTKWTHLEDWKVSEKIIKCSARQSKKNELIQVQDISPFFWIPGS